MKKLGLKLSAVLLATSFALAGCTGARLQTQQKRRTEAR